MSSRRSTASVPALMTSAFRLTIFADVMEPSAISAVVIAPSAIFAVSIVASLMLAPLISACSMLALVILARSAYSSSVVISPAATLWMSARIAIMLSDVRCVIAA